MFLARALTCTESQRFWVCLEAKGTMDLNFNIADLFTALEKFKAVIDCLRNKMDLDEVDRERFKTLMRMVKKDIEEMFNQTGKRE